jgi:NTE family protein
LPNLFESVFNTFEIMEASIVREKMRRHPPTVRIEPATEDVELLDFQDAERILEQTTPLRDEVVRAVRAAR